MKKLSLIVFSVLFAGLSYAQKTKYYVKKAVLPADATIEQKIEIAAHVVPTPQQLAWQQQEMAAFIHFGINTFTNREWGDGKEDPALFNPTNFNAEQWVKPLKDAGFKMLILTAKHHDGFCLWPTKTTEHSVKNSPWKNGKGDVVKEVKEACDKYGMRFGVYLSPWDRNAESYGDSPRYNDMFVAQLTELLTQYGEIDEVWFDGANGEGPNGKKQVYDWKRFYQVIADLQPKAVKAIMGDDVRWVGNESGLGRATEWSVTPLYPEITPQYLAERDRLGIGATSKDLGSREIIGRAKELHWWPSEVDVSIRPGWFYHADQDAQVKSLKELVDIYFQSVGMNSGLLLNVPPDTEGRLHKEDVSRLLEYGHYLNQIFKENRIKDKKTNFTAKAGQSKELKLNSGLFNVVLLQEDISKGQRVEKFTVEALINGTWQKLTEGTTIGYKRLLRFPTTSAAKIRITIDETRAEANIANVGLYYAPEIREEDHFSNQSYLPHNEWNIVTDEPLTLDLGKKIQTTGFAYYPPKEMEKVFRYRLEGSLNGKDYHTLSEGEFSNVENNPIKQTKHFNGTQEIRYLRFKALEGSRGGTPVPKTDEIFLLP